VSAVPLSFYIVDVTNPRGRPHVNRPLLYRPQIVTQTTVAVVLPSTSANAQESTQQVNENAVVSKKRGGPAMTQEQKAENAKKRKEQPRSEV